VLQSRDFPTPRRTSPSVAMLMGRLAVFACARVQGIAAVTHSRLVECTCAVGQCSADQRLAVQQCAAVRQSVPSSTSWHCVLTPQHVARCARRALEYGMCAHVRKGAEVPLFSPCTDCTTCFSQSSIQTYDRGAAFTDSKLTNPGVGFVPKQHITGMLDMFGCATHCVQYNVARVRASVRLRRLRHKTHRVSQHSTARHCDGTSQHYKLSRCLG
jgi:hypothetical protein